MGDVAALQTQLDEKDAKIAEVKDKAKQFVRERMEVYKTAAAQQDATISGLQAKLAEAEADAQRSREAAAASAAAAVAAPPAAAASPAPGERDAETAALISQLRADVKERELSKHASTPAPQLDFRRRL